jgi:hypothetical protein
MAGNAVVAVLEADTNGASLRSTLDYAKTHEEGYHGLTLAD